MRVVAEASGVRMMVLERGEVPEGYVPCSYPAPMPSPEEIAAARLFRERDDQRMNELCDLRYRPKRTWSKKLFTDRAFRKSDVRVTVPAWLGVTLLLIGFTNR